MRFPELDWRSRYPSLAVLSDRMDQRPSFRASVPYPQTISDKVM